MIGVTSNRCAGVVITKSIITTVRRGEGVGAKKVFTWGARPAGQSCAFTREIRQGGV